MDENLFFLERSCKDPWVFLLEQVEKINLEVQDTRITAFKEFIFQKINNNTSFDQKYIRIFISFLINEDAKQYEQLIESLLLFHEKDMDKDELAIFVSILRCEIKANSEILLREFDSIEFDSIEAESYLEDEILYNTKLNHIKSNQSYVVYKGDRKTRKPKSYKSNYKKRTKYQKVKVSSVSDKIIDIINKEESFLIYEKPFNLPKGVKRIRIKKDFDSLVKFVEEYIIENDVYADLLLESDRLKVIFNNSFPRHKQQCFRRKIA